MSALYTVPTGEVATAESATKSLILLNPGTQLVAVRGLDISIRAKEALEPIRFDVYRVVTLGSPTGAATTPILTDPSDAAALSSALTTLTAEPTSVSVLASYYVEPYGGLFSLQFPFGSEPKVRAGGSRFGVRYTTPAGVKPSLAATLWIEE